MKSTSSASGDQQMGKTRKKTKKKAKKTTPKRTARQRPYPQRTLEEALAVPQAIRDKNNGNPWQTEEVAKASLGVSKKNPRFFYAAAASRDYGLTVGSRDTEKIELMDLGRRIVFAGNEEERRQAKIDAFLGIDIFKKVLTHYGGSKLPGDEFVRNTLQSEFDLDPDFHAEFLKIFKTNCKYIGIEKGLGDDDRVEPKETDIEVSDVRVVGQPKGKFDRTAFVIMPLVEKGPQPRPERFFTEVLNTLITPAGNKAGFAVETAEQKGSDIIHSTIIDKLLKVNLAIVDLTDHNPNVLFELGIRLAKQLPVALIKAEGTGPIFDVDNLMRVLSYNPNLWATTVNADLPKLTDHIKTAWDNRDTHPNYMQILTGRKRS